MVKKSKVTAEQANMDPYFDSEKVKRAADIPPSWLWTWFGHEVGEQVEPSVVSKVGAQCNFRARHVRQLATGISDSFCIEGAMLEKTVLAAFWSSCHVKRNCILKAGRGFFKSAVAADGAVASRAQQTR